ncbi:hypothetical protein DPEC_G00065520 [Dallia pectoralis]|uniref:Uncharacterized protein n=1 Tax=Dallia pectoralis TaxID=75939 RepID=A0ACC2H802_DALPE|nr:hypothetical protein DPEC_G00065520 [Dallia pectoralis]
MHHIGGRIAQPIGVLYRKKYRRRERGGATGNTPVQMATYLCAGFWLRLSEHLIRMGRGFSQPSRCGGRQHM